jgi:hypothetical protein
VTARHEVFARAGLFIRPKHSHLESMKRIACATCLSVALALPVAAQDGADGPGDMEQGFSLLEEGARLMLRGLMAELAPMLDDMEGAISDLSAYHAPEILPNGDILLRRKVPIAPEAPTPESPSDGAEIDI